METNAAMHVYLRWRDRDFRFFRFLVAGFRGPRGLVIEGVVHGSTGTKPDILLSRSRHHAGAGRRNYSLG